MVRFRFLTLFHFLLLGAFVSADTRHTVTSESADEPRELGGIQSVPATLVAEQILREAYSRRGITIDVSYLPSRRVRYLARLGQLDGDLFRVRSMQREYTRMVRVPTPLLTGHLHCVVKDRDSLGICENLGDVKGPVAIHRGVRVAEEFVSELGIDAIDADRYQQMASLVRHGRVKAAIVSSIEGIAPFSWPDWKGVVISETPLRQFTLYHYIHNRYQKEAGPLAEVLDEMRESGWTQTAISQFIKANADKVIISGNLGRTEGE